MNQDRATNEKHAGRAAKQLEQQKIEMLNGKKWASSFHSLMAKVRLILLIGGMYNILMVFVWSVPTSSL